MRSEPSKSILITGARGGIGHATVARLVDLGHSVFAMRIELAPFGVRVVLVEPGVVETGLYRSADESLAGYDGSLDTYRRAWPRGFSFPQWLMRHASSADAVAEVIARAALTPDPGERYRPGLRNRMNVRLLTRLPASVSDGIKTRLVGMERART
jgi:NAD(P)-dependent dehydrogenase (short-subunit alcohol dehydrogenase family)